MTIATVICLVATAVLVLAAYAEEHALYVGAKFAASGAFLVVGYCACLRSTTPDYARFMMFGLACGAVGDILLLGKSQRAFIAGLVAFLVGHVHFIIAFATVASPWNWLNWSAAGSVLLSILVAQWVWPHAGRLRYAVMAYLAVITVMRLASMGSAPFLAHPNGLLAALGGIAFYASDYCVAREKFVAKSFTNKLVGLPLYFGAQLLFAYSM